MSSLSCGIVGLPNAGKSTLFNAFLKRQVSAEGNYPFTTIKPHEGVVEVPDRRLELLAALVDTPGESSSATPGVSVKIVPVAITFIDIAGLVKGAHQGAGLGNEFLGHVREVDLIVHVIRAFADENVAHVEGSVDPARDRQIIAGELVAAGINRPMIEWINADIDSFDRLDDLIQRAYRRLGLITFYTIKGGKEVRATALQGGQSILTAAEKIHTDFAKKFIKAEVAHIDDVLAHGSWHALKKRGKLRLEGKDYPVADGDVIEFKVGT